MSMSPPIETPTPDSSKDEGDKKDSPYSNDKESGSASMDPQAASEPSQGAFPALSGVRDGLLRQRMRELNNRGENITIICAGDNGLGKSTLLSNLFARHMQNGISWSTKEIHESVEEMVIEGFHFKIKLVDTPGYGDFLDVEKCFRMITEYLDNEMDYIDREMEESNNLFNWFEAGIDVLLYFIAPHRLKEVDIALLKRLHGKVTIIPILAKADTMTSKELVEFKAHVIQRLAEESITTFKDPFAVIASEVVETTPDGEPMVGRKYEWGVAECENEEYSDLPALRRCLVYDGLADLHTEKIKHYQSHRNEMIRRTTPGPVKRVLGFTLRTAFQALLVAAMLPIVKGRYDALTDGGGSAPPPPSRERSRRRR